MALLTPEQLERIREIIRDSAKALAISTGHEVSDEELQRLVDAGWVDPENIENLVLNSYEFGMLKEQLPAAEGMSHKEFTSWLKKNPVPMSDIERNAFKAARDRAGELCVGLGNRWSDKLGRVVIEVDENLAQETRKAIREKTSQSIARREGVGKLRTELRQLTKDYGRDWDRIANTETQLALEQGFFDATVERHGAEALMAKIPNPDACVHCQALYLENGLPIVRPASWWEEQGVSNIGRKQKDWKPVLGAAHPNCLCKTVRVPDGWKFNEDWELMPPELEKGDQLTLENVLKKSDDLEKSRKLHDRIEFQGLQISIENRKGSIRQWYDPHNKEKGTTKMLFPYGYLRLTEGLDGDHCDCYVGPNSEATHAYVVHQKKAPSFTEIDEDKIMLGFNSLRDAKKAYLAHYNDPRFLGSISVIPMAKFKERVLATKDKPQLIKGGNGVGAHHREWLQEIEEMHRQRLEQAPFVDPRTLNPMDFDGAPPNPQNFLKRDPFADVRHKVPLRNDFHAYKQKKEEREAARTAFLKDGEQDKY